MLVYRILLKPYINNNSKIIKKIHYMNSSRTYTDKQLTRATRGKEPLYKENIIATINPQAPRVMLPVAFNIAGKVITERVTYGT